MIRLLTGDCRDVLKTLADGSVHCVVTSPPYMGLRDYGTATWDGGDAGCDHKRPGHAPREFANGAGHVSGNNVQAWTAREVTTPFADTCGKCGARRIDRQLGLEATPDEYIATMVQVFREVKRVMRPDATLWLNVGSSYASGGKRPSRSLDDPRALACGNGDTEPLGSQAPDYAYPGRDDGRLDGSPSHREHNAGIDPQMPPTLPPDVPTDRDTVHQVSVGAQPSLLGALASTSLSSSWNAQDVSDPVDTAWVDLSDDPTSPDAIPLNERNSAFPSELRSSSDASQGRKPSKPGNGVIDGSSAYRKAGKGVGSASCDCGSCGICFAYSAIPMLQFKAKDLMLMPELLALALQADGWWLRSDIIWAKPNPMPESCRDRPTNAHEHVYLLAKKPRYFYDAEAVREEAEYGYRDTTGAPRSGCTAQSSARWRGVGSREEAIERGPISVTGSHPETGRSCRNVWTIATAPFPAAHFATFPPELAERCIRAGTSERGCCAQCGKPWVRVTEAGGITATGGKGARYHAARLDDSYQAGTADDVMTARSRTTTGWSPGCQCNAEVAPCVVLDPFSGAGTALLVADRLGRDAVGIDLSHAYVEMARERLTQDCPLFADINDAPVPEPPEDERMADLFAEAAE